MSFYNFLEVHFCSKSILHPESFSNYFENVVFFLNQSFGTKNHEVARIRMKKNCLSRHSTRYSLYIKPGFPSSAVFFSP